MSGSDDSLTEKFGQIDIYLFDQLLKGRIQSTDRVLDAGCGSGRNILYLMRMGCRVSAVDTSSAAVVGVQELAHELQTGLSADNFRVESVENLSFEDAAFDVVLSSAVLHFAKDAAHFGAMVREMWRVLRPGGMLWARLASSDATAHLRQGSGEQAQFSYLITPDQLEQLTTTLGGQLLDPIKTTLVHNSRSMTTWVVRKT